MLDKRKTNLYSVAIHLAHRRDLDTKVDKAVAAAIEAASRHGRQGILVSRQDHRTLTVELSDTVPYGQIKEVDLRWQHM
ncbi:hypothetical protein ASG79_17775 [Arthrobacter sp. Soil761]|jgi:hypothetical protein|nr:hypothetical protein ASG79_17775 [Arthrobacter sp. Soil761]